MSGNAAAQLRRVLQLVPELADGREHKVDVVAKRLGVDRETLLRDLDALVERYDDPGGFVEGVQIFLERDAVSVRSDHFLRPMRLTMAELAALELGLAMLRAERPPDEHAAIHRARARLRTVLAKLPSDGSHVAERVASTGAEADAATLGAVRRAIRAGRKLAVRYRASGAGESTRRVVRPYAPVLASGAWYLVAHCERSEGIRVFRLDRIEEVEQLAERCRVPKDFSVADVLRDGRVFHGEPAESARVRYGPAVARWVAERERKPLDADGSLTLEHPLADEHWLVRHVLQYGADAEVLAPEHAREAVRRRLREI
ncbi:MAG TPA: WYL domain-containing protein [Gemmatimonadales bacterium]|nr:WYL domain-containing protein [Gemmatimonadales bacterium]